MSATKGNDVPQESSAQPSAGAAEAAAFGAYLRTRRERLGVTLDAVAAETKIRPRHFVALERGDVDSLPRGMYARAMLRAYSESVGLDAQHVVGEYERVMTPRVEPPVPAPLTPPLVARRRHTHSLRPAAVIAVLVVMAVAVGLLLVSGGNAEDPPIVRTATNATDVELPNIVSTAVSAPPRADTAVATTGRDVRAAPARVPAAAPAPVRAIDGTLEITSDPPGARVTVNGVGWGETPVTIRFLPFGSKQVRLIKPGYLSAERTLRIDAGRPRAAVRITLEPRPVAKAAADQQE